MTKRQQKLIDVIHIAQSCEEKTEAFKDALEEVDPGRLPLIALLMQQKDDRFDEKIICEFLRDPSNRKC